jgi:hypothetical protein
MQRRQFIPQEAISFVEIAVVFIDLFDVMSKSRRGYVSTLSLKPNGKLIRRPAVWAIGHSAGLGTSFHRTSAVISRYPISNESAFSNCWFLRSQTPVARSFRSASRRGSTAVMRENDEMQERILASRYECGRRQ